MGPKRALMQQGGQMGRGDGRGRGRGGRGRGRGGGKWMEAGPDADPSADPAQGSDASPGTFPERVDDGVVSNIGSGKGMRWPPVVKSSKLYGEITDVNGRNIPRDQGRSIQLGQHTYYVFGDTFCHNDNRLFVGTTDNTIAYIPDKSNPTKSQYLSTEPRVPQYIPYTESEWAYTNAPENRKINTRIVLWSFSGLIEDTPGCGQGWIFFDKQITTGATFGHVFGTSVARVKLTDGNGPNLRVDRVMGDEMLFGTDDPKFGSIAALADDDGYVYIFGQKNSTKGQPLDLRNHWARIKRTADFTKRANYEFLLNNGKWSPTYQLAELKTVMPMQLHGAALKLPGFAPRNKGPYMWFGVNKFMGNHLYVGTSSAIEGPWQVEDVMELPKMLGDKSKFRYCLYPHPWAGDLSKGQMLISWSDDGDFGGRVGCAMLRFEMVDEPSDVDEMLHQQEERNQHQKQEEQQLSSGQQNSAGPSGSLKEKLFGRLWK